MNFHLARLAIGTALAIGLAASPFVQIAEAGSTIKPRVQSTLPKAAKASPCAARLRDGFFCYKGGLIHCVGGRVVSKSECLDGCDTKTNNCVDTNGNVGAEPGMQ